MRYKGLTIVLFAVVTFGFVFGSINYNRKLKAMLGKDIIQASVEDFIIPPVVETPEEEPMSVQREVLVPSLTGLTKETAVSTLEELDLVAEVVDVYSDEYEKGTIFQQYPEAGITTITGKNVSFSVSLGKNELDTTAGVEIIVPNLIGMSKEAAESELKEAGFNVGYEYNPSESYDEGFVYSQNYKVGAKVAKGTQVTIRISSGR